MRKEEEKKGLLIYVKKKSIVEKAYRKFGNYIAGKQNTIQNTTQTSFLSTYMYFKYDHNDATFI